MKNKKLAKLAKFIYEEIKNIEKTYTDSLPQPTDINHKSLNYNQYDEQVSEKFKNFILNILKVKDKIRIEISDSFIYINGDLNSVRSSNNQSQKYISSEDIIDIRISKDGFSFCRGYAQTFSYDDKQMYDELYDELLERSMQINKDIIIDMIDDIMVKTNLSRGSNLDKILD